MTETVNYNPVRSGWECLMCGEVQDPANKMIVLHDVGVMCLNHSMKSMSNAIKAARLLPDCEHGKLPTDCEQCPWVKVP